MVLQASPKSVVAQNNLGVALLNKGQVDEALTAFRTAASLQPNDPVAYFNLGEAFVAQNQRVDAVESYRSYVKLAEAQPDHRDKVDAVRKQLAALER